jgi:osmotically inducible protein OsmC
MALSAALSQKGHAPTRIHTKATVHFGPVTGGFAISRIELDTVGQVPGIDAATFEQVAQAAKLECPVSKALAAVEVSLVAKLPVGAQRLVPSAIPVLGIDLGVITPI